MSPAQVQEKVQAIVERTVKDQGLQLQVTDPVALHVIAQHVLAEVLRGGGHDADA